MGIESSISDLPEEILAHIFSFYVSSEGHYKLLKNIGTVCVKWSEICKLPSLWKSVDDPKLTIERLIEFGKLGILRNTTSLNLRYISISTEQLFQIIENCNNLQLGMSGITVIDQMTSYAAQKCKNLKSFKLDNMTISNFQIRLLNHEIRMQVERTDRFFQTLIEVCGTNLVYLSLSNIRLPICNNMLLRVSSECHHLEELHVSCYPERVFMDVSEFQEGCPKLKVLKIFNCNFNCTAANAINGFRHLEVFMGYECKELGDKELYQLLGKSTNLHTLGLNGSQVSCKGLLKIPAENIQRLYVSDTSAIRSCDFNQVISRWKFTLRVLDISLMADEQLMHSALSSSWGEDFYSPLEVLNLSGSSITILILRIVLLECPYLFYLNVESCLKLPINVQKIYRTSSEFKSLRSDLLVDNAGESKILQSDESAP